VNHHVEVDQLSVDEDVADAANEGGGSQEVGPS
jgi:hypothetical protein